TTVGTTTDNAGNFTLAVPANAKTLQFSSLNFNAQEVSIGIKTDFSIILQTINQNLEEVVVVGYGTQKKNNLTASVATI
ncbi:carboxypeptidase-like regulatory domain-containing protein, partial [Acinetobacter baumannii]